MRIQQVRLEPFELQTVTDFESISRMNEHGYARITGYATEKQKNKNLALMTGEVWGTIAYVDEEGKTGILFCGIAVNMQMQAENDLYLLTFEWKTGTCLMDMREHIRVYQSSDITYSGTQDTILSAYQNSEYRMLSEENNLGKMAVQYKETDWEFIKRLASRKQTVLIPNERSKGIKYMFGIAESDAIKIETYNSCRLIRAYGELPKKQKNGVSEIYEADAIAYEVTSREIFFIGECILFEGKRFLVSEVQRTWQKKEVWNRYILKKISGMGVEEYYNKKLIGASLNGRVTDVQKDMVQINIDDDENGNQGGKKWFAYATVFSSPDGTGWYCMPEVGDSVQLHFPNENEADAYVNSSVNKQSSDPTARSNPDYKSIKNKQGKEILFTPEKLVITNNKGMTITIDDENGIIMESDKDIIMKAQESIGLMSEKETLEMAASNQMVFKQNETVLSLTDRIAMSGGQVNMQ